METVSQKFIIEEFTGVEFYAWRKRFIAKLRAIGLWRLVSGQELPPDDEGRMEMYLNRREKAFGIMMLSLSVACQDCLKDLEEPDPVEAWKRIEMTFDNDNPDTESALLENLISIRSEG
jgi:hypothetical protein